MSGKKAQNGKKRIVEVCYADSVYEAAQKWNVRFAKWFGRCNEVYSYNKESLPAEFVKSNERFFKYKRGGGYWIWKSFIIKEVLDKIDYGDYLFYCDSGALLRHSLKKLIKVMENDNQDAMFFEVNGHLDREWTKRDVFIALDCDKEEYYNTTQRMSGFILIKKTERTISFAEDYCTYSQQGLLITDEANELGKDNYEGFRENRHDQSILSLLSKKYGYRAYRDPSQWGDYQKYLYRKRLFKYQGEYEVYERSKFPTMLILHRYKKLNLHNILAHYYHYWLNYNKIKKEYRNKWK